MLIRRFVIVLILVAAAVTVMASAATAQSDEEPKADPGAFGVSSSVQVTVVAMSTLVAMGGLGIVLKRYKRNDPFLEQRTQQPPPQPKPQESTPDKLKSEQVLATVQVLSKQVLLLLVATLVISVYLIQRSVSELLLGNVNMSTAGQMSSWGRSFSYLTLSLIWPLVLGCCCVAFQVLLKRHSILDQLSGPIGLIKLKSLKTLDPWQFDLASYAGLPRFARYLFRWLLALTPLLSMIALLGAQIVAFLRYAGSIPAQLGSERYLPEVLFPGGIEYPGPTAPMWLFSTSFMVCYLVAQLASLAAGLILISDFPRYVSQYLGFIKTKQSS